MTGRFTLRKEECVDGACRLSICEMDCDCDECAIRDLVDRLAAYEDTEEQGDWISVKDRLPELGETVIATDLHATCMAYTLSAGRGWAVYPLGIDWEEWTESCSRVTHWMPLPELPKQ